MSITLLCKKKENQSKTSSTQPVTSTPSPAQFSHGILSITSALIPVTTNPLAPLVSALRDDSTESDQSITYSHIPSDAYQRIM